MSVLLLPFEDRIESSSGANAEGFALDIVRYGGKVSQLSYVGENAEASREEDWTIKWAHIDYATPEQVANGATDELGELRTFYKNAQLGLIQWKPFEYENTRIWRIKPNSLKVKNIAGCVFKAQLDLEYLYEV